MPELDITLAVSAFIAGVLMFIAPCTLPLVPGFIAYVAGIKSTDATRTHRGEIVRNSFFYVIGFSVVFIIFGMLAGLAGTLAASLQSALMPVSGVLIIIFGLQLLHIISLDQWLVHQPITIPTSMRPGSPLSAFVIGAAFATGWTPCIGPILATILLLAGTSSTVVSGGILLALFSLGLALPFMVVAVLYSQATAFIASHSGFIRGTEVFGGLFLILLGCLLLTNNFDLTIKYGYELLNLLGVGNLLDYY